MSIKQNTTFVQSIYLKIRDDVLNECKYMKQSFSSELLVRAYKKGYSIKNVMVKFTKRNNKDKGTLIKDLPSIIYRSLKGYIKLRMELF